MLELAEYFNEKFTRLNVFSQKLAHKTFENCTFESCDFSETILEKCIFNDCHFIKCNLSVLKIGYSKFRDITFEDCKVIGVDWTKGSWSNLAFDAPLKFARCTLNSSSFYGMQLKGFSIQECTAHDVDFREADLSKADFYGTDLSNSQFGNTNLTEASFIESINYTIDVRKNQIKNAKFCRLQALSLLDGLGIELLD